MTHPITLYHAPHSRSGAVRILLDELDVPYALHVLDLKRQDQRGAAYLAVNPMGKVPAIRHGETLVTEQAAVLMYLADLHAAADLAPEIGDPLRGVYLRWMVFYGSSFEPAIVDRALDRAPAPPSMCPYGDYDTMLSTVVVQLTAGPWLLGARFTAADVLWGYALGWMCAFKLVPDLPELRAYVERVQARPSFVRVAALDAELDAELAG
jgi:glutathione S-transferase